MKNFSYRDERVIIKGRLYYLRTKYGRRGSVMVLTIRTQRNGKGARIAQTKGVIVTDQDQIKLIHKLHKKKNFQYVIISNIPELPK